MRAIDCAQERIEEGIDSHKSFSLYLPEMCIVYSVQCSFILRFMLLYKKIICVHRLNAFTLYLVCCMYIWINDLVIIYLLIFHRFCYSFSPSILVLFRNGCWCVAVSRTVSVSLCQFNSCAHFERSKKRISVDRLILMRLLDFIFFSLYLWTINAPNKGEIEYNFCSFLIAYCPRLTHWIDSM